jgi:hypothetical protein
VCVRGGGALGRLRHEQGDTLAGECGWVGGDWAPGVDCCMRSAFPPPPTSPRSTTTPPGVCIASPDPAGDFPAGPPFQPPHCPPPPPPPPPTLPLRYGLYIKNAPEPSDINYENIEFGKVERSAREALVGVGKYSALMAGFALISFASALRYIFMMAPIDEQSCDRSCAYKVCWGGGGSGRRRGGGAVEGSVGP